MTEDISEVIPHIYKEIVTVFVTNQEKQNKNTLTGDIRFLLIENISEVVCIYCFNCYCISGTKQEKQKSTLGGDIRRSHVYR